MPSAQRPNRPRRLIAGEARDTKTRRAAAAAPSFASPVYPRSTRLPSNPWRRYSRAGGRPRGSARTGLSSHFRWLASTGRSSPRARLGQRFSVGDTGPPYARRPGGSSVRSRTRVGRMFASSRTARSSSPSRSPSSRSRTAASSVAFRSTGGLLARVPSGTLTLAQEDDGDVMLSSRVSWLLPAACGEAWPPAVDRAAVCLRPVVGACRHQQAVLLAAGTGAPMKIAVFGATGVIGRSLDPETLARSRGRRRIATTTEQRGHRCRLGCRRRRRPVCRLPGPRRRRDRLLPRALTRLERFRGA